MVLESLLALLIAGALPLLLLNGIDPKAKWWAAGAVGLHVLVGNVLMRLVMPALHPKPTGVARIPEVGEHMQGSLAEYEATTGWLYTNLLISLAVSVGIVAALTVTRRRQLLAEVEVEQGSDGGPQVVGERCAVCSETITFAPDGEACEGCELPLHLECASKHRCEGQRDRRRAYRS